MAEQQGLPIGPSKLTESQREQKLHELLGALALKEELEAQKAAYAKSKNGEIAKVEETVSQLRRVLQDDEQLKKQGDLFVDPNAARNVLAAVHEQAVKDQVDGIVEQALSQDSTDPGVPTLEQVPDVCPTCGKAVRQFGEAVTCEDSQCPWSAKIAPSPEAVEERRAEAQAWIDQETSGGAEALAGVVALWWLDHHRSAEFDAAMVAWRADSGAPVMVPEILRDAILAKRSELDGAAATAKPPCDHAPMQGKKSPPKGKSRVCVDCNETLRQCEACKRYEVKDALGPCEWDECGSTMCTACLAKHEALAAEEMHRDGDGDGDGGPEPEAAAAPDPARQEAIRASLEASRGDGNPS